MNVTRKTFAIISHPDAGKTTLTEAMLFLCHQIHQLGTIKGRKSGRSATSDWMALEQQRGISITTSMLQLPYDNFLLNLLDTPGHADFSEDTYRTLMAVDAALIVLDAAKGIEARTLTLFKLCRQKNIPMVAFVNKMDRYGLHPFALLDAIEKTLACRVMPANWPIGSGTEWYGLYNFLDATVWKRSDDTYSNTYNDATLQEELSLVKAHYQVFQDDAWCASNIPVFFGSALNPSSVKMLLKTFAKHAPPPQPFLTLEGLIRPDEPDFVGFVFKIQANMNASHRDRLAFCRVCAGQYTAGQTLYHVRTKKYWQQQHAVLMQAGERFTLTEARPGDVIGLVGDRFQIGDMITQGRELSAHPIPYFSPECFQSIHLDDPSRYKAFQKGLQALQQEGTIQLFRTYHGSHWRLGAIGALQFDVVAFRLKEEYRLSCSYQPLAIYTVRWLEGPPDALERFKEALSDRMGYDYHGRLVYFATSAINLQLTMEQWPELTWLHQC
jgi:peptide chain release factor 3